MLKYTEQPAYKKDKRIIHFILMGICFVVIVLGVLVYFNW
jgi:hypothetical protein